MKCVCGYEEKYEYVNRDYTRTLGDQDFVEIDGHFTIEKETDEYYRTTETRKVKLYACPTCNTVLLDDGQ